MVNRFRCTHGSLGFKPFLLLVTLSVRMRFGLLLLRMNLPGFVGGGGFGISPFHFGRAVVPTLVTRTFKGQCVRGDLDFQRLEKARSGLAELCAQWEASIRAGTQQKTWFHACRRLALVDDVWLRLPEEVPSLCEVQNLLGSVRAYIDSRNQRVRYHDLQTCNIACWHLKRIVSVGPRPSMSLGSLLMTPLLLLTRLNLCGVPSCVSTTFPLLPVVRLLPVLSLLLLWCLDSLK